MKVYSPSCTPCIMSAPTLDCLASKFPSMLFGCVRGDLPANQVCFRVVRPTPFVAPVSLFSIMQAFLPPIRGFPTFLLYFRGSVIDTIVGANMKLLFEAVVKAGQVRDHPVCA
jgi:thiol-disulfide isomerase/thioredoxin